MKKKVVKLTFVQFAQLLQESKGLYITVSDNLKTLDISKEQVRDGMVIGRLHWTVELPKVLRETLKEFKEDTIAAIFSRMRDEFMKGAFD